MAGDQHPDIEPPPGDVAPPPESPAVPRRRSRCGCCLGIFLLLCIVAALGNFFAQRTRTSITAPGRVGNILAHLPPSITEHLPLHIPEQRPHDLPDDLRGVQRVLEPVMRERFAEKTAELGIQWPPKRVRLVGLKAERVLEMWVADDGGDFRLLKTYPVLAASGSLGPKRRQGDKQVPEGHYRLVHLNTRSRFHLSLLLDYPNAMDQLREQAALVDGKDLGGDICVHGSNVSIGCLAIGDAAIEEVFTMVSLADPSHRDILIFPADFRQRPDLVSLAGDDPHLVDLYTSLAKLAETVADPAKAPAPMLSFP